MRQSLLQRAVGPTPKGLSAGPIVDTSALATVNQVTSNHGDKLKPVLVARLLFVPMLLCTATQEELLDGYLGGVGMEGIEVAPCFSQQSAQC